MDKKKDMINDLLNKIDTRSKKHNKRYKKLRLYKRFGKITTNVLSAVSVSSIVLTFSPALPIFSIVAIVSISASGIIQAFLTASDIDHRLNADHTSYLQYRGLYRSINNRILRNHLTSKDYDEILDDVNAQVSLIEDSSYIL